MDLLVRKRHYGIVAVMGKEKRPLQLSMLRYEARLYRGTDLAAIRGTCPTYGISYTIFRGECYHALNEKSIPSGGPKSVDSRLNVHP